MERAFKKSSEGQRLNKLIREKNVELPTEKCRRLHECRKVWPLNPRRRCGRRAYTLMRLVANSQHQSPTRSEEISRLPHISRSAQVVEVLIMATRSVFIDSTFTLMQTPRLSTLNNLPWGSGITIIMGEVHKRANIDPTMHKNDRGGSIQRKRLRQEDLAALPSKSLGRERSVSRSRDPSQRFLEPSRNVRVYSSSPARSPHW
jgi:hypothetical protein